jgi:hypothetical protein
MTESNRRDVETSAEATKLREEEKVIEGDKERDEVDKNDFKPGVKTGKTIAPTTTTSAEPVVTNELKSAYAKCWTIVNTMQIPRVYESRTSFFVPNLIAMCQVLFQMEEIMYHNDRLRYISPFWFSLPVRVYYSVLTYVAIYRSKQQSGEITVSESRWLRAFSRKYEDVSLPIAGPLVPIFANIASSLPDDDMYEYVYPTAPIDGTYSSKPTKEEEKSNVTVTSSHFILPSVPLLGDMLRQFGRLDRITDDLFDEHGNYVPFRISNGGRLGGVQFPPVQPGENMEPAYARLLCNPMLMSPLPEGPDDLRKVHSFYKRRATTIDFPNLDPHQGFNPINPGEFTCLSDQLGWFQTCIDMALAQCRFFSDSTNLSALPTLGGQSVLIQASLYFQTKYNTRPTTLDRWFPSMYRDVKARFRSTTAETPIDQVFESAFALTNAKIQWLDDNGHAIGSRASGLKGGPFFDNRKFNHQLDNEVEVITGVYSMLQSQFYDVKGNAGI